MTTRTLAHAPRLRFLAASLLALALLAPAGAQGADDFALECDVMAGIFSLRLTGPAGVAVRGRALDERTWVYEIEDPSLSGLRPGPVSCVAAQAVRVLPGYLLGTRSSRIVVRHAGDPPRSYSQGGRHRLTWLPEPRAVIARSEPAPEQAPQTAPVIQDDGEQRRLEAELQAQREENERVRRQRAEASKVPSNPAPVVRVPSKQELRQQAQAEKRAEREARRDEQRARKQAKKQPPPPAMRTPPPEPASPAPTPVRAAVEQAPVQDPPPERGRVVVRAPAQPAATPRSLPPDFAPFPKPAMLVVTIPTDMKDGPGRRYETLRRLGAGERVMVSGRASDWYRVGSGEGWVFSTYLESASAGSVSSSQLGVVQDVTVPVLEGPGGQHAVVAELYRGQQVVIDELKEEWAHVRNGGWVRRSALGELKPGQEK